MPMDRGGGVDVVGVARAVVAVVDAAAGNRGAGACNTLLLEVLTLISANQGPE